MSQTERKLSFAQLALLVLLPFAAIWAVVALWLGRDYRRRARELKHVGVK